MGGRIAVLTVLDGTTDETVARDVAMHVAAINPRYVNESQIPEAELEHENCSYRTSIERRQTSEYR